MKYALVTGVSSGFGMYTALELAHQGFHVLATMRDVNNRTQIEALAQELSVLGRLTVLQLDVTKQEDLDLVAAYLEQHSIQIQVLVNNAGYCQGGFFQDLTEEEWQSQFQTNFFGAVRTTKTLLPFIPRDGSGKMIAISSVSGFFGFPGMSAYASSKFALEGWGESLRLELLNEGIWVSLVQPAAYQTKIWERGLEKVVGQQIENAFQKNLVKEAMKSKDNGADPREVARLVAKIVQKTRPKFRYPVGKGAKSLAIGKRWMAWSWIEGYVYRFLKGRIAK
ncbi:SDR family NAD(P)-dependent oxidoreductase [Paenibacillus motobuensis]|uniref:SDR family NAD(P)-dependent oxidoreductase n=1 Tax=Paenibacillus TaxID=44249 RepID=UPI0020404FCF|nr:MULTISPECIES: SDR family NAD(P)-dependent oxidoreductase [Paenibacillus]MCM3039103.1 SDR family NAD(P)-dependent oxidoreductase [Paenibacillus lutimineralis]MCM3646207.1 SDR family NAD(P)-dependent oxidoreductase [Paenibacillus motobuensis]